MSLTSRERETQNKYDDQSYEWLKVSGGPDRPCYWSTEMKSFTGYLGRNKNVIELGCGPATDGKYLLEEGCKSVVSIDYSRGMLSMAKDILSGARLKPNLAEMDMYKLGFSNNSFDGFWASASFLHLENPWEALREVKRVIKPGGFGFISVKEGIGEEVSPVTGYYFHYFKQHGLESFCSHLAGCGFNVVGPVLREAPNHNWLTYIVQKGELKIIP